MLMNKLQVRGLRQLRLKFKPKSKITELEILDKDEIRRKVQSLNEFEDNETVFEPIEWGVGSKFQFEAFSPNEKSNKSVHVSDTSLETVLNYIKDTSSVENLKVFNGPIPQVILNLSSAPARRALFQSILTSFKPLFPKRCISVDGENDKKAEWIVIDLKSVIVHIFEPQARKDIDLDGKLEQEIGLKPENPDQFLKIFGNSLPRSIASRPNFIDKFNLLKNNKN